MNEATITANGKADVQLVGNPELKTSFGELEIEIEDGQVWLDIPDRFGHVTGYNFSRDDWAQVLEALNAATASAEKSAISEDGLAHLDQAIESLTAASEHIGIAHLQSSGGTADNVEGLRLGVENVKREIGAFVEFGRAVLSGQL